MCTGPSTHPVVHPSLARCVQGMQSGCGSGGGVGLLVRSLFVEGEVLGLVLDVRHGGPVPVLARLVVVRARLARAVA